MTSVEEVAAYIETLVSDSPQVSVAKYCNGKEVMFEFSSNDGTGRMAAIRTPGSRWFSVEVEGAYDQTFVDEDASDDEVRVYLARCIDIAKSYVLKGATTERQGLLRWPTVVVDAEEGPVRLSKIVGRRVRRR